MFEELEPSARLLKDFWRFRQLMKKITMFLTIRATVAMLALPVAADYCAGYSTDHCRHRSEPARTTRRAVPFTENRTADQAKAFEAAKKYLACPIAAPTESQTKIIEYLKKWVGLYEKGSKKNRFNDELYNKRIMSKPSSSAKRSSVRNRTTLRLSSTWARMVIWLVR